MMPAQWIILNNLSHGWTYRALLAKATADAALAECEANGWVADGKITQAGREALDAERVPKERKKP